MKPEMRTKGFLKEIRLPECGHRSRCIGCTRDWNAKRTALLSQVEAIIEQFDFHNDKYDEWSPTRGDDGSVGGGEYHTIDLDAVKQDLLKELSKLRDEKEPKKGGK